MSSPAPGSASRTLLVVGGGGREHAIVWACAQSVDRIVVAPGNGGTEGRLGSCAIERAAATSVAEIVDLCKTLHPEMVIVGPEAPLADGLADTLAAEGIPCFGPRRAAARLESSKAFSKDFMSRHKIPTASYRSFTSFADAEAYIRSVGHRVVVKASGLAAGKGVFVPNGVEEAVQAARAVLEERIFGDAGSELVVEEFLGGVEVSVLAFTDGRTVVPMPGAQDHKRAYEFDMGANTGGMGAFAPSPVLDAAAMARVTQTALQPVVDGMRAEGCAYVGVLYAGLMVRADGSFSVLEYNCRLGDPETQVLLPLLETPFVDIARACVAGTLEALPVRFKKGVVAATVVAAAGGYPDTYAKGAEITVSGEASALCRLSSSDSSGSFVFHAGTRRDGDKVVTNGGRVLAVTSLAPSLAAATAKSYKVLEGVSFEGMFYRRDIGKRFTRPFAQSQPLRIGVLGSTRGSNLLPILAAIESGDLRGAEIRVVISNRADAGILEKAAAAKIESHVVVSAGKSREDFDAEAMRILGKHEVDLVLLVGFMRILSPKFVQRYAWRILNVHPSLLPNFAGAMDLQVHEAVLASGVSNTGCTVHFVEEGVDTGAILWQSACSVDVADTPLSLKAKVQQLEGQALISSINLFLDDAPVDVWTELRRPGASWAAVASRLPSSRLPRLDASSQPKSSHSSAAAGSGSKLTYSQAGVDIDAGDALVENLKPLAKSTARTGADADLGGFGGLFDLKAAGYVDPLLVSGTDGVGTKLKVAQIAGIHDTVGIDLVAMSVNDILVQGAEPLLFLDYFATGHLDVAEATAVVKGIADGCKDAGCALIGGETAEMPSMYAPGDYDLAGFAVGAVERDRVLPEWDALREGDVILGIASSGVHSNGFSLVRKVITAYGFDWQGAPPFASHHKRLCEAVLQPTKIYVKSLLPLLRDPRRGRVKALAHITGGGLPDNVPRVLRPGLQAYIDATTWTIPPVFRWLQSAGTGIDPAEMARTFNIGIGMVVVVAAECAAEVQADIASRGEQVFRIGELRREVAGLPPTVVANLAVAFGTAEK